MPNPRKVLLVENDEFTRYMMREIISTLGVEVEIAVNGEDGVQRLIEQPSDFGLVLMDIHMPKVSGIEATKLIRDAPVDPPSGIPIVAVTADSSYHDNAVLKRFGMDGFASKPVTPGQLLDLIDKYCPAA